MMNSECVFAIMKEQDTKALWKELALTMNQSSKTHKGSDIRERKLTSLNELNTGVAARIVSFTGGRGFREKMNGMGLFPGTEITVIQTNGSEGMMLISIGNSRLMVGHGMAGKILTQRAC